MRIITSQERIVIIMFSSLLILGLAVKSMKDHYYTETESLALISTNDTVVDYYVRLNKKDIELAGMLDIHSTEIEELTTLPGIGVKTAGKIINKRNKLGRYNVLEEIMLVPGIGRKTYEKIFSYSNKLGI
tara:strand:- start:117 stop:506 length:390 start_codon:yes stop_codon:yes gene_type:complete